MRSLVLRSVAAKRRQLLCAALVVAATFVPKISRAEDPALLILNAGVFDLVSHRPQRVEGRLEYRFGHGLFESDGAFRGLKPIVGFMMNSASANYAYAGLAGPIDFGDNGDWEFTPAAGMGAYHRGHSIDLGGTFEFHLALGLSYRVTPTNRFGIAIDHISNAQTHMKNPGVNSILATWAFAFNGL